LTKSLGPLAVLDLDDCTATADEETRKALGPWLSTLRNCTRTADEETRKALGPLAVARRHILPTIG